MPAFILGSSCFSGCLQFVLRSPSLDIFWNEDFFERLTDNLQLFVAQNSLRAGVPTDDPAFWIEHKNGKVLHILHQEMEQSFAIVFRLGRRFVTRHLNTPSTF